MSCNVCQASVKAGINKIICDDCKNVFHLRCVDLTDADLKYIEDENQIWRCEPCSKNRRKSLLLESTSQITFDDVLKLIKELKDDFKNVEKSLGTSLESCHEQLIETNAKLESQKQEIASLTAKLEEANTENINLRRKVITLENRIEDLEQYSRRNCLEIHGIPVQPNENVVELVKKVGQALDFTVDDRMIDACHRLHAKEQGNRPPGIIVKMVRRIDAETLIAKRRVKRNLNTTDVGLSLPQSNVVYVNENLTPARRRLFNLARTTKQEKQYTFLWVRGGKILMRKADKMPVKVISSTEDLDKL